MFYKSWILNQVQVALCVKRYIIKKKKKTWQNLSLFSNTHVRTEEESIPYLSIAICFRKYVKDLFINN